MSVTIEVDERTAALQRARAAQRGEHVLAHSEVVRWLRTWGTSCFRPRSSRRM
jgi:predicted transcriptional regulator